jgi:hypothetical protein
MKKFLILGMLILGMSCSTDDSAQRIGDSEVCDCTMTSQVYIDGEFDHTEVEQNVSDDCIKDGETGIHEYTSGGHDYTVYTSLSCESVNP